MNLDGLKLGPKRSCFGKERDRIKHQTLSMEGGNIMCNKEVKNTRDYLMANSFGDRKIGVSKVSTQNQSGFAAEVKDSRNRKVSSIYNSESFSEESDIDNLATIYDPETDYHFETIRTKPSEIYQRGSFNHFPTPKLISKINQNSKNAVSVNHPNSIKAETNNEEIKDCVSPDQSMIRFKKAEKEISMKYGDDISRRSPLKTILKRPTQLKSSSRDSLKKSVSFSKKLRILVFKSPKPKTSKQRAQPLKLARINIDDRQSCLVYK